MVGRCERFEIVNRAEVLMLSDEAEAVFPAPLTPDDAESVLIMMFRMIFPQCPWPPAQDVLIDEREWNTLVFELADAIEENSTGAITRAFPAEVRTS